MILFFFPFFPIFLNDNIAESSIQKTKGKKEKNIQAEIKEAQLSMDDGTIGMFYCVYYDNSQYWGKLLKVKLHIQNMRNSISKFERVNKLLLSLKSSEKYMSFDNFW